MSGKQPEVDDKVVYARKVSSKGQIVLPMEVRDALGIRQGDYVEFRLAENEAWVISKCQGENRFSKYAGALKSQDFLRGMDSGEFLNEIRGEAPKSFEKEG